MKKDDDETLNEASKTVMGYATLLALSAWRAAEIEGADDARFAETEAAMASGKASLGIFIQKTGDHLLVSWAAIKPTTPDPFQGKGKILQGPMIIDAAHLESLVVQDLDSRKLN